MISVRKLESLGEKSRLRKFERLFHQAALHLAQGRLESFSVQYLSSLASSLAADSSSLVPPALRTDAHQLSSLVRERGLSEELGFACYDVSLALAELLGVAQADWDLSELEGPTRAQERSILPIGVILDRLRSPFNVGSIFRSSDSFGVQEIILLGNGADPQHPRAQRTARGCVETVAYQRLSDEALKEHLGETPLFALESGGASLTEFAFPPTGYVIVGSEELGVSPELLSMADNSWGRVSIDVWGTKGSLNVSVATGILLHFWASFLFSGK